MAGAFAFVSYMRDASKDQERTRYSAFYMFLCGKTDSSAPSGHLYQCH